MRAQPIAKTNTSRKENNHQRRAEFHLINQGEEKQRPDYQKLIAAPRTDE